VIDTKGRRSSSGGGGKVQVEELELEVPRIRGVKRLRPADLKKGSEKGKEDDIMDINDAELAEKKKMSGHDDEDEDEPPKKRRRKSSEEKPKQRKRKGKKEKEGEEVMSLGEFAGEEKATRNGKAEEEKGEGGLTLPLDFGDDDNFGDAFNDVLWEGPLSFSLLFEDGIISLLL